MQKEIIVDTSLGEVRIAVAENGKLVELYLEHEDAEHYAGDIYKGRVEDVLPGLGSAFVDIGHEKRGLLHASDVIISTMRPSFMTAYPTMGAKASSSSNLSGPSMAT